jgi:thymidine phosphorylase
LSHAYEPAGNGIGPLLEAADALKVLEQDPTRPIPLEKKSLKLAGELLKLCLESADQKIKDEAKKFENPEKWAESILVSGAAHKKMMEIIDAQKGDPTIISSKLHAGPKTHEVKSDKSGVIKRVNNRNVSLIAKILGAPLDVRAGLFLKKRVDNEVKNNENIFDMFAQTENHLQEAIDSFRNFPIYEIE